MKWRDHKKQAMALCEAKCGIRFAWWITYYLDALMFFTWLTCQEPDYDKVVDFMLKGVTVEEDETTEP